MSLTYEPGRVAFAGRAATFAALAPLADEHRELEARAELLRAARARCARATSSARCSRPAARAWIPRRGGAPARGRRRARGARARRARDRARCCARAWRRRRSRWCMRAPGRERRPARRGVRGGRDPVRAASAAAPFGDTAIGRALIGLLRCVPAPRAAARRGELGGPARLAARAGPARAPRAAPTARDQRAAHGRCERGAGARRCGRSATGRWTRSTSSREAARARARRADRAGARELEWLFARPGARGASVLGEDELDEARALPAGRRALAELRELARLAPELAPARRRRSSRAALERVEVFSGAAARGREPWRCSTRSRCARGACGRCSCAACRRACFPARARAAAAAGRGGAPQARGNLRACASASTRTPLAAERYLLYAAVSRPEELLVLSWHVADDDGEPTARSLFVDDVCDLFDESLAERAPAPAARRAPSAGRRRAAAAAPPRDGAARRRALRDERRARRAARARRGRRPRWRRWIGCPMRWFVERVLAPGAFDPDPEPLARGGLAHAALKDTLEGLRARRGSARADAGAARARARAAARGARAQRAPSTRCRSRPSAARACAGACAPISSATSSTPPRPTSPLEPRVPRARLRDRRRRRQGRGERAAGVRARRRRRGCAGGSTASTSSDGGEAVVYDYKSSVAPAAPRSGSARASCRWRCTCARSRSCSGCGSVGRLLPAAERRGPARARRARRRQRRASSTASSGDRASTPRCASCSTQRSRWRARPRPRRARGELEARPQTCAFGRAAAVTRRSAAASADGARAPSGPSHGADA